jgi:hypothetical protein
MQRCRILSCGEWRLPDETCWLAPLRKNDHGVRDDTNQHRQRKIENDTAAARRLRVVITRVHTNLDGNPHANPEELKMPLKKGQDGLTVPLPFRT